MSSKPVNAAHMTHAYCVTQTLIGAYSCFLLDVDWVLIAPIYDKNGVQDSVVANELMHDAHPSELARAAQLRVLRSSPRGEKQNARRVA